MKKVFLVTAVLALLSLGGVAQADVAWKGVTWDPWNNGYDSIAVNGSNLEVATVGSDYLYANAHYSTSLAATPWVEATFVDSGTGAGACLSTDSDYNYWAAIGIENGVSKTNYVVSLYDSDFSGGDVVLGLRSAGSHTMKIGRRADGTMDFWFDGSLAYSKGGFADTPTTNIWLGVDAPSVGGGQLAVYTDYKSGTDYVVPEPSSIIALLGGLGSLLAFRRRRA